MATKTETFEYIECDICHQKDIKGRRKQVIIKGYTWDICFNCFEKNFAETMIFLTVTVGLDIDYKVIKE